MEEIFPGLTREWLFDGRPTSLGSDRQAPGGSASKMCRRRERGRDMTDVQLRDTTGNDTPVEIGPLKAVSRARA